jgi:integrase
VGVSSISKIPQNSPKLDRRSGPLTALDRCASVVVLLDTGMRISETFRITIDQCDGKYFRNVIRKGKRRDAVYLSPEGRAASKDYFDEERGTGAGPLFQSRNGEPLLRNDAERYLKQIGAMSNANVPDDEQVSLHSHLRRRTGLKRRNRSGQGRLPGLSLVRAESIWPYRYAVSIGGVITIYDCIYLSYSDAARL